MNAIGETRVQMSEKVFMQAVIDCARWLGWRVYHTFDSRRSAQGFPDLCCIRGKRLIVAELKTARGKVTDAQAWWLAGFLLVPNVEIYVWRPADWLDGTIERVLSRGEG